MGTANESQMEKNYCLPYFPHIPQVSFPAQSVSNLPDLKIAQQDGVGGILNPIGAPYLKDSQSTDKAAFDAPQKRFLIFDQSGNDTRLFFSPAFSPNEVNARIDRPFFTKQPMVEEKWDENHLSGGDMLEDSEEIDALLYSDSDDDEYDEVTSMNNQDKLLDDKFSEQVASSGESRKLGDGKYKKSSSNDAESSCDSSNERANKVKIRKALKILETIIPGLDKNDPLSIIDQAVVYLKSMKREAEEVEVLSCYTGCNSE